ncbi:hypothetical protein AGMMS50256_07740 [Betaproteobacteria bacterium]|nr:hypothetical protein AGMMS50256_07740 [Betaproteobacteria bacterium]
MPRTAIEHNSRIAMWIQPDDKIKLMRACALEQTDLTEFILRNALLAEQRMRWFRRGLDSGDMRQCDTFKARRCDGESQNPAFVHQIAHIGMKAHRLG